MFLEHSSYSYPTHLVPIAGLLLFAFSWLAFAKWPSWAERIEVFVESAARRLEGRAAGALASLAVVALASTFVALGWPQARVSDEISYLFAAETYATGQVTNPSLDSGRAFAYEHVLDEPTRQSKYPPAQGVLLATGVLVGHPALGLLLGVALLVACAHWAARQFTSRFVALLVVLVALLRIGVGGYWHQSYWGGGLAATGSLLVVGALGCLARGSFARAGVAYSAGAVLLAATRPFESILFCAAAGALALVVLLRHRSQRWGRLRFIGPAALVLGVGLGFLLFYNHAVTGEAWQPPHLAYTASEVVDTHFVWEEDGSWVSRATSALVRTAQRTAVLVLYLLGLGGVVCLSLAWTWRRRPHRANDSAPHDPARDEQLSAALSPASLLLLLASVLLATAITRPFHVHYLAPATGPLLVLLALALERLRHSSMAAQRALAPALLVSSALWCLVQLPAHRPDPGDWSWRQAAIDSRLQHTPGRHLVVVEDRRGDPSSWALPTPDPFDAQVVWAEEEDLLQWVPQGVAVWRQRLGVDRVWRLVLDREGDHLRPFE